MNKLFIVFKYKNEKKRKKEKEKKKRMFPTPPTFQAFQAGIPPTANPGQTDTQKPQKSPFIQQSALLPPPSHYPGIKLGLPTVPQGTIIPPSHQQHSHPLPLPTPPPPLQTTVKTFRRGPPVAETYLSSTPSSSSVSAQNSTSAPTTLFEKHGICHSLSYITYLKSIAAEPPQDDALESSPSPPLEHPRKNRTVHKRHRRLSKIKQSVRTKIVAPNGDIDVNYSSSCPSSPDGSGNEDSKNLDLFDAETEDTLDKALSKNPEEFFFSGEFLENEGVYEDKPNYDLLRDCRILTDEEVARRRHEKNMRLSELYKNELMHLRDVIRVRHRRFFLRQVVKDNEKAREKRKALLSSAPVQQTNGTNPPSEIKTENVLTDSSNSNIPPSDVSKCSVDSCQKRCVPPTKYCFNRKYPYF